jgi:thiamine biosynthesis protein ThiS
VNTKADSEALSLTVNGEPVRIAPGTVADLVTSRGLSGKRIAVERNGSIVPRSAHASTALATGDSIEIVVAVGGG